MISPLCYLLIDSRVAKASHLAACENFEAMRKRAVSQFPRAQPEILELVLGHQIRHVHETHSTMKMKQALLKQCYARME
jgi:hypothetical protein